LQQGSCVPDKAFFKTLLERVNISLAFTSRKLGADKEEICVNDPSKPDQTTTTHITNFNEDDIQDRDILADYVASLSDEDRAALQASGYIYAGSTVTKYNFKFKFD
jgi:hypothetical protein